MTESEKLYGLFEEHWEYRLRESPFFATHCGDRRYNDKLPAIGVADCERRLADHRSFASRLSLIDRKELSARDEINRHIFETLLNEQIEEYQFQSHLMPVSQISGFHIFFPELPNRMPLASTQDYENYIARLRGFKRYEEEHIELMAAGIDKGYTMPKTALAGCPRSIRAQIVTDARESILYRPFASFPARVQEQDRLRREGQKAINESVIPAYREFLEFMEKRYLPAARDTIAVSALPDGEDYYRHLIFHHTTLDLTPDRIHEIGLGEVERIRVEMEAILKDLHFSGSFAGFVESLKNDPRFYVTDPRQLLKEASLILKTMDGELPRLFKKLPRVPYGIKEVPDYAAAATTCAYYSPLAGDGSRAGIYYVNTSHLESRPLYELEPLSLHEAVPGHHLQFALQYELKGLPAFRRFGGFSSFIEGWALYAERLGLEVGFYQNPYHNFARLGYEIWRACRLVVDTGIHHFKWPRRRAIEFMVQNSALTRHNIEVEIDRYIAEPAQALAYKIGEIKIRELRTLAEQKLGRLFDLRDFHEVVLVEGSIPLPLLESRICDYIEKTLACPEKL